MDINDAVNLMVTGAVGGFIASVIVWFTAWWISRAIHMFSDITKA
jgi:hypothetical protein